MFRVFAAATILSCFILAASAQTPPAPAPMAQSATPAKPAAKKSAKAKSGGKLQAAPAESGPCQIGVISTIGDKFTVQKVGVTVFGNEFAEVPVEPWGLDDLVVARVRAVVPGMTVRKIAYAKGAFEPYYHPPLKLFRNQDEDLSGIVRQVAGNAGCARYVVLTTYTGQLDGTNQGLPGIGVINRDAAILSYTFLFANISVRTFDGQTFAVGKNPYANLESVLTHIAANLTKNETMHKVDNSAFPASPPDAVNSAALRDGTRDLLAERLDKILPAYFKE
jgi:hypothetical protein